MTPLDLTRAVARVSGLAVGDVLGRSRSSLPAAARAWLVRLLREEMGMSYREIGRWLSRAHNTVLENDQLFQARIWPREWKRIRRRVQRLCPEWQKEDSCRRSRS